MKLDELKKVVSAVPLLSRRHVGPSHHSGIGFDMKLRMARASSVCSGERKPVSELMSTHRDLRPCEVSCVHVMHRAFGVMQTASTRSHAPSLRSIRDADLGSYGLDT